MVAHIPIDEQAVVEPASREEELNVGIIDGTAGRADVGSYLDVVGDSWSERVVVAKEVRSFETVVVPCLVSVV